MVSMYLTEEVLWDADTWEAFPNSTRTRLCIYAMHIKGLRKTTYTDINKSITLFRTSYILDGRWCGGGTRIRETARSCSWAFSNMTKGRMYICVNGSIFFLINIFQSGLPPNWWQLNEEQTDTNFKLDNYFNGGGGGGERFNEDLNEAEINSNGNRIGTIPTHI